VSLPPDPFNRIALPADFSRAGRVQLLGEAAQDLMSGRLPSPAARLFLAGALQAWLEHGGRVGELERVYLRTSSPERSRLTAPELWRRSCARTATSAESDGTMATFSTLEKLCTSIPPDSPQTDSCDP
jgi:hypothetical protein